MTRGKKPYCNPIICPWDGFRAEIFGNIVIRGGEKSSVKVFLNIELQCVWVGGYHRQVGLESPAQLRRVCPPLVKSMLSSLCTPWPDIASKNCITYVEYLTGHWKSPNTNDSLTEAPGIGRNWLKSSAKPQSSYQLYQLPLAHKRLPPPRTLNTNFKEMSLDCLWPHANIPCPAFPLCTMTKWRCK